MKGSEKGVCRGATRGGGLETFKKKSGVYKENTHFEFILKVNKFSLKGPDSWSVSQIFIITSWPKCSHSNT